MRVLHPISKPILPHGGDVCILGSTGSIGVSTLEVIDAIKDRDFRIKSLVCGYNVDLLIKQALKYNPSYVACADKNAYQTLKNALPNIKIYVGDEGILEVCNQQYHYVMSAIVGKAGLKPTITAAKQGTVIALANKECVVVGGNAFMDEIEKRGAVLFPVDSEHSALYHLKSTKNRISKYIITASGGPFRDKSPDFLSTVTVQDALKHPNWSMGAKISVDSATMANKGLELIEAKTLFGLKSTQIDAVIHRQSIVHGMVVLTDGAVKLYACEPDMKIAIGASLNYGSFNHYCFVKHIDFNQSFSWDFEPINLQKYPCFRLAKETIDSHFLLPTVFNAANEVAVAAFLNRKIAFNDIAIIIEKVLNYFKIKDLDKNTCNTSLDTYIKLHDYAEIVSYDIVETLYRTKKVH
ncbi:MAG: 1-deoxy-D-xylulose-5-phosphate reductoisomerase [Alphaproteobacteria bacterium]|jgi:1-deoxy-D-xylulose-5-phosphate reductoisomerase